MRLLMSRFRQSELEWGGPSSIVPQMMEFRELARCKGAHETFAHESVHAGRRDEWPKPDES